VDLDLHLDLAVAGLVTSLAVSNGLISRITAQLVSS